ncbi:hypothetical protein L484_021165 [Morus notabilis]|uniref:Uncharacterized protein n=1 Tax=Morus notabilis TaxID=981085 RepID=W9R101_9ROSA|nr:hypothetical protein L484_021165 [Morus notabilis]
MGGGSTRSLKIFKLGGQDLMSARLSFRPDSGSGSPKINQKKRSPPSLQAHCPKPAIMLA